jgi:hypothetical protein
MSNRKTTSERDLPWIPLIIGLIAGLALGLFTGWVIWPVEYTGATFMDMPQQTRIAYISAVADAYTMHGTSEAALEASQRLAVLGEHMPDELLAAIDSYRSEPNQNLIRVSNLAQLAVALGVPVDANLVALVAAPTYVTIGETPDETSATQQSTPPAAAEPATTAADQASGGSAEGTSGGSNTAQLLLSLLLALVLVGLGLWGISKVLKRRRPTGTEEMLDDYQPEGVASADGSASAASRISPASPSQPAAFAAGATGAAVRASGAAKDPYAFDEDDEGPAVAFGHLSDDVVAEADEDTDDFDDGDEEYDVDDVDEDLSSAPVQRADGSISGGAPAAAGAALTGVSRSPAPDRAVLASFTAHFLGTATSYRGEAQQIKEPVSGRNLGEFGLQINDKNSTLSQNREHVNALEVYMFDKYDERNITNVRRVLLSEQASDRDFDQVYSKEGENLRPFVAQPNTPFKLEGRNLVLTGSVVDVTYDPDGVFQSLTVNLAVVSKR